MEMKLNRRTMLKSLTALLAPLPTWLPAALPAQPALSSECGPCGLAIALQCLGARVGYDPGPLSTQFVVLVAQERFAVRGGAVGCDILGEIGRSYGSCIESMCPQSATALTEKMFDDADANRAETYLQSPDVNTVDKIATLLRDRPAAILLNDLGHMRVIVAVDGQQRFTVIDPYPWFLWPRVTTWSAETLRLKLRLCGMGDVSAVVN